MKQKSLIFKLVIVNCLLLLLIAGVYYSQQEKQDYVLAQDNLVEDTPTGLICDFPIPVASPLKDAVALIDNVYQEYYNNFNYLESAISTMQGIIEVIGNPETEDTVCDFTVCRTNPTNAMYGEVANVAFDLELRVSALTRSFKVAGLRPGICIPGDCVGNPCKIGTLEAYAKELDGLAKIFAASYGRINDLFSTESEVITYDLAIPGDAVGGLLTPQDAIYREIDLAGRELQFCSLTALEQKRKQAGEHIERETMRCDIALDSGLYWPAKWSEKCLEQCSSNEEDAEQKCNDCLGECKGDSVLAVLNCKIYRISNHKKCGENQECCGDKCRNGSIEECGACLQKGLSRDEYRDLLCAGTVNNSVCCYKGELAH